MTSIDRVLRRFASAALLVSLASWGCRPSAPPGGDDGGATGTARAGLSAGQLAPVVVYMAFDGDPSFPSLTWQESTAGLAPFAGHVFGITSDGDRAAVVDGILAKVREDYAPYPNVQFVTTRPPEGTPYLTWGLDDRAVVYDSAVTNTSTSPIDAWSACPLSPSSRCSRLNGKAGSAPDPAITDAQGRNIFAPTHARTFAGSFAIPSTGASPSYPPLVFGTWSQVAGGDITLAKIAQALGNSAAHEIGHLLRLSHPVCSDGSDAEACFLGPLGGYGNVMIQNGEGYEARSNKTFSAKQREQLAKTLTVAARADALEPDDLPGQARPVTSGAYELTLHDPSDEDFLAFDVPAGQATVRFELSHEFPPDDQGLRELVTLLVDEERCAGGTCLRVATHAPAATTMGFAFEASGVPAGTRYLLHVSQTRARLPVAYRLSIGLAPDRFEAGAGNDTAATAAPWSPFVCMNSELTIDASTDVDFYGVAGSGYSLEASATWNPDFGDLAVTLDGASATLVSHGYVHYGPTLELHAPMLVYDRDRDVTWLRQASPRGRVTFAEAQAFVDELNAGAFGGGTHWRLPAVDLTDSTCSWAYATGTGCTGSDLGHLFYEALGNTDGLVNRGPFTDVFADLFWTGQVDGSGDVFFFSFFNGLQDTISPLSTAHAWAVHDGDLAPGSPLREVRVVGCGQPSSIVGVSGDPMPYALCIRRVGLQMGCPGYVAWTPFAATGAFDYTFQSPWVPGPPSAVHADVLPRAVGRVLSQDDQQVTWQVAAWLRYPGDVGQPVLATLSVPRSGGSGPFEAHVLDQPNLIEWFQIGGQCTSGRTDLVNCDPAVPSQCNTTGASDGACTAYPGGSGAAVGPPDAITSFAAATAADAMFWHVLKPADRGTLSLAGALDSDRDCISNEVELATGTDPLDDDTDGDGIPDGGEDLDCDGIVDLGGASTGSAPEGAWHAVETDPRLLDSDGDGLSDGLEIGLTRPLGEVQPGSPTFVADTDPASTTNPLLADTDGDGRSDGDEDADHDGRQDPGETSPLVADPRAAAPPANLALGGPSAPIEVGTPIALAVSFEDPAPPDDTHTLAIDWGDGTSDTFGSVPLAGTYAHAYAAPGVYSIGVTVTDASGAAVSGIHRYVVVYDPATGFVTGGGWFSSPPGAWKADPSLAGRASFGFVAKYERGATAPRGSTQLQLHFARQSFRSTAYEWLVVAGARAQFKGTGSFDGAGDYGFLLSALDGALPGGGGADRIRAKIWDRQTGAVVYDSQAGEPDDSEPSAPLGGGQIVIHR